MGYERKRGKLTQFNSLIEKGTTEPFLKMEGDINALRDVRYVTVLDSDTSLPTQSAWKMAATLAHPLNHPHIDPRLNCVDKG